MTFPLVDLCLELREKVYEQSIDDGKLLYQGSNPSARGSATQSATRSNLRHGLAVANKQISREFLATVYRRIPFHFKLSLCDTFNFDRWNVSQNVLSRLRYCHFEWDEDYLPPLGSLRLHVPALVKHLKSLEILYADVVLPQGMTDEVDPEPSATTATKNEAQTTGKIQPAERKCNSSCVFVEDYCGTTGEDSWYWF